MKVTNLGSNQPIRSDQTQLFRNLLKFRRCMLQRNYLLLGIFFECFALLHRPDVFCLLLGISYPTSINNVRVFLVVHKTNLSQHGLLF